MSDEPVQATLSVRVLSGAANRSPLLRLALERIDDLALVAVWLILVIVAINVRPLLPIDETRYLTVAWEMWQRNSFLVPLLNGEAYSHKPPLLFWLIHAGWSVFGVQEWWGRIVAPLFGLFSLFGSRAIATALWPESPGRAALVPWLLLGCATWAVFTTVTMFDMLVVTFTALALFGLIQVWRGRAALGFSLVAAGIGLGVLAKGPVVLVYILPSAAFAPLWMRDGAVRWSQYYAGLALAVVTGAAIALAWALPAAGAGGPEYGQAILWGQTAGRVADAFAHERPWWWYLPVFPALLFPWIVWPAAWRAVREVVRAPDTGVRLALVWLGSGVVLLTLISSKQPHYLLPLFPAVALLLAAGLDRAHLGRWNAAVPAFAVLMLGAVLAGFAYWLRNSDGARESLDLPEFATNVTPWLGVGIVLVAGVVLLSGKRRTSAAVSALALQSAAAIVLVHVLGFQPVAYAYDVQTAANFIRMSQMSFGRTVSVIEEYHGQFGFEGRLTGPLRTIATDQALGWLDADDGRRRIVLFVDVPFPKWMQADYQQLYRGRVLAVIDYNTWSAYLSWRRTEERRQAGAATAP